MAENLSEMTLRVGVRSPLNKNTHRRTITQTPTERDLEFSKNIRMKKPEPVEISLVYIATILSLKRKESIYSEDKEVKTEGRAGLDKLFEKAKKPWTFKENHKRFCETQRESKFCSWRRSCWGLANAYLGEQGSLAGSLGAAFPPALWRLPLSSEDSLATQLTLAAPHTCCLEMVSNVERMSKARRELIQLGELNAELRQT